MVLRLIRPLLRVGVAMELTALPGASSLPTGAGRAGASWWIYHGLALGGTTA